MEAVGDVGAMVVAGKLVAWAVHDEKASPFGRVYSHVVSASWDAAGLSSTSVDDGKGAFGRIDDGRYLYQGSTADSPALVCSATSCDLEFAPVSGRLTDYIQRGDSSANATRTAWLVAPNPAPKVCLQATAPVSIETLLTDPQVPGMACYELPDAEAGGRLYIRPNGAVLASTHDTDGIVAHVTSADGALSLVAPLNVRSMAATERCGEGDTRIYVTAEPSQAKARTIHFADLSDPPVVWKSLSLPIDPPFPIAADSRYLYAGIGGLSVYLHPTAEDSDLELVTTLLPGSAVQSIDASDPDYVFFTYVDANSRQFAARWAKTKR